MGSLQHATDETLVDLIRKNDQKAFEELYRRYWDKLFSAAYKRTESREVTAELIQDFFTKVWLQRRTLIIAISWRAYAFTAIKYSVLDYLEKEAVRTRYRREIASRTGSHLENNTEQVVYLDDLTEGLETSLGRLSHKCRQVFELSRKEGLSMREIAVRLNISEKTVEYHLGNAIKHLRVTLKDYITTIVTYLVV